MSSTQPLSCLAVGLAAAGLHLAAQAAPGFITIPVQTGANTTLASINPKINLGLPNETQITGNDTGTVTVLPGAPVTAGSGFPDSNTYIQKATRVANVSINSVVVGQLYERVWCKGTGTTCNATNTYILGQRLRLNTTAWSPTGASFEINDLFRAIRPAAAADIAYFRGTANPLPKTAGLPTVPPFPATQPAPGTVPETASSYKDLEFAGRTLKGLFEPSTQGQNNVLKPTSNGWMDFRIDVNKADPDVTIPFSYSSEWSPWLLVRQVCPTGFNAVPQPLKVRLWQGGEEGQTPASIVTSGYVCN
jgi:hypothetical protein